MKQRAIRRYMRLARFIGQDDNPCYSRQIGAVITTADGTRILGTGYNGPPPGTPHTDSLAYLADFFWPKLTPEDKEVVKAELELRYGAMGKTLSLETFLEHAVGAKECPRNYLNAQSGERSDFCTCGHAERHAITNAACDLRNSIMFCWCGVPCLQCADAIIQAGIKTVHCLIGEEYHQGTLWLFQQAGVAVVCHDPKYIKYQT